MFKSASIAAVICAVLLAGCASRPPAADSTASAGQASTAARIAPAVPVPAASARRVVLSLTGPKNITDSKDWNEFKREWNETFADHARAAGVAYSFADTVPANTTEDGTLLLVTVNDYRIVGIAARIWLGIMTGNAFIDAKVSFRNVRDGSVFGEQQYNTTSSASGGVFAKVTPQQVDAIAKNVFIDFKAGK